MDKEAVVTPLCKGLVGNDDDAPINALESRRMTSVNGMGMVLPENREGSLWPLLDVVRLTVKMLDWAVSVDRQYK